MSKCSKFSNIDILYKILFVFLKLMFINTIKYLCLLPITSHKKFSEGKQVHVGMKPSKTNQHFHTIPTSCAILAPLAQICFVLFFFYSGVGV